ncbi:GH32 C-terminal domain-containing protein [Streptomyces sp. NPDC096205]|uniref:GH32 C-terminal domain-containing protein n=1 Tax=Streptomyces sp. NPDC096205 TaxID=3366081 RepID=UPI0037FBB6A5
MTAPDGRQLMWGWAWENFDAAASHYNIGGCLTVAREVHLHGSKVRSRPVAELATLRGVPSLDIKETPIASGTLLADAGGHYDAEFVIAVAEGACVRLNVLADAAGTEHTDIVLDRRTGLIGIDTTASTLYLTPARGEHLVPGDPAEPVHVRALVEANVLEVFIDGRPFTARIYPSGTGRAVTIAADGDAHLLRGTVWPVTESTITDQRPSRGTA